MEAPPGLQVFEQNHDEENTSSTETDYNCSHMLVMCPSIRWWCDEDRLLNVHCALAMAK